MVELTLGRLTKVKVQHTLLLECSGMFRAPLRGGMMTASSAHVRFADEAPRDSATRRTPTRAPATESRLDVVAGSPEHARAETEASRARTIRLRALLAKAQASGDVVDD